MAKAPGKGMRILAFAGGLALFIVAWRFPVPVPLTAKTMTLLSAVAVVMGSLVGWREGAIIAALYVGCAILGVPPAIWGGHSGEPFFASELSGLSIGLVAAAFIAGRIAPGGGQSGLLKLFLAMVAGHVAFLACGFAWAMRFENPQGALAVAVYPFLIACAYKTIGSTAIAWVASKFIK